MIGRTVEPFHADVHREVIREIEIGVTGGAGGIEPVEGNELVGVSPAREPNVRWNHTSNILEIKPFSLNLLHGNGPDFRGSAPVRHSPWRRAPGLDTPVRDGAGINAKP